MYIIALAWIYVVGLVALLQSSWTRGVLTFFGAGVLPLLVILYLMGAPQRGRNRRQMLSPESSKLSSPDDPSASDLSSRSASDHLDGEKKNDPTA